MSTLAAKAFPTTIESVHLITNTEVCGVDDEGYALHRVSSITAFVHERSAGWHSAMAASSAEAIGLAVLKAVGE